MPTASGVRRASFIDGSVAEYRRKGHSMAAEFVLLLAIGFVAQLVDGTLGMAYGVLTNAALLTMGLPPAQASALVHTAEVFTTGASAASHLYHRNVDWRMVARLGVTGVLAAPIGGWAVKHVSARALMIAVGVLIVTLSVFQLLRAFRLI